MAPHHSKTQENQGLESLDKIPEIVYVNHTILLRLIKLSLKKITLYGSWDGVK